MANSPGVPNERGPSLPAPASSVWHYATHFYPPTDLGKALGADRQIPGRHLTFVQ